MTQDEYVEYDMEDSPLSQDEYDQRLYDEIAKTPGATFEILHEKMLGLVGPHSYSAEAQLWDSLWRMDVRRQIVAYWEYPVGTTAETLGNKPRTRHYQIYEGERPGGEK